jgi:ribose transport system permease protein
LKTESRKPEAGGAIRDRIPKAGRRPKLVRSRLSFTDLAERYALLVAWGIVIAVFGALEPETFLSSANFTSIFGSQTALVILTLALLIPLTAGDYDLSVAGMLGLSAMTIAVLNSEHGVPIMLAILIAIGIGVLVGLINGLLTVGLKIESLIVTLGTGTIMQGMVLWISNSETVSGVSPKLVHAVIGKHFLGLPLEFYYGLGIALAVWYVFDHTPVGRRLLFTGRGRSVARLSGVSVGRVRVGAMVGSAVTAAVAGVVYVGTSGAADTSSWSALLLPAFAAAFLGATAIKPGRFNAWGSFIAVYFLVTGITGLQLLGVQAFVQQLFYGGALVAGVALRQILRRGEIQDEEVE